MRQTQDPEETVTVVNVGEVHWDSPGPVVFFGSGSESLPMYSWILLPRASV